MQKLRICAFFYDDPYFFQRSEKAHIYFQDDVNVGDAVIVYVGMTKLDFLKEELGAHEIFDKYKDDVNHAFRAKKIFLHPKLQTSKVLKKN